MNHDPFENETTKYSLEDFVAVAKAELDKYLVEWKDVNAFHKEPHTWDEWFRSFLQYMSW